MTLSLLLLCAAATALVAMVSSALVGLALFVGQRRLDRMTPAAESRVLLFAALAPIVMTATIMLAALAPSIGWIVDHCAPAADPHGHPHICTAHHVDSMPGLLVVLLAGLFVARVAAHSGRQLLGALAAMQTRRRLLRTATVNPADGMLVLPADEPQAFVVGFLWPILFVTRGLVSGAHQGHLRAVVSHEMAHLRRRDPLRRVIAKLSLGFHLPGVARWLDVRLARVHEQAADADAAAELGDAAMVADALVALTRAAPRLPVGATAFAGSGLELRITRLMLARNASNRPAAMTLLSIATLFVLVISLSADAVHHSVEGLLGLIGG